MGGIIQQSFWQSSSCVTWFVQPLAQQEKGDQALKPLYNTFLVMRNPSTLRKLGFVIEEGDLPLAGTSAGVQVSLLTDEATCASRCMRFMFHLCSTRLRSLLWYQMGLPGRLPALLDFDPALSAQTLKDLKQLDVVYSAAVVASADHPDIARQVSQSFMVDPIPSHAMSMLKTCDFEVPRG